VQETSLAMRHTSLCVYVSMCIYKCDSCVCILKKNHLSCWGLAASSLSLCPCAWPSQQLEFVCIPLDQICAGCPKSRTQSHPQH
jgi:hypothetical protein